MGWTPSGSKAGEQQSSVEPTRFDPWQNRPDRPVRRQRAFSRPRALLVWLTVLAVLVVGYTYHDDLAVAGWRTLARLFPGLSAG